MDIIVTSGILHVKMFQRFGQKIGQDGEGFFFLFFKFGIFYFLKEKNYVFFYRFANWGDKDPHRPAEDLAFAVARFYQLRGTLQNYYMVFIKNLIIFS